MPAVHANGINIYYESTGQGEPMTVKDWEEAFHVLRSERSAAQANAASKMKRAAKPAVDISSLKDSLKALKKL